MQPNPLLTIKDCGQSIWLDYIQRGLLAGGEFQRLIDKDGIDLAKLTERLEREGIQKFIDAYDQVLSNLAQRMPPAKGR
jgi:transaldolase